jgi:dolichol-phosphate mannosyltransferase
MRVSIVIPTYNEAENLSGTVHGVFEALPSAQIVIVDDNSPDGTGKIADMLAEKNCIKVVHRPRKMGLGQAIAAGFKACDGDIIVVMDADGTHPIRIIPELIAPISDHKADIVVACRINGASQLPMHRRIISWVAMLLARPLTKVSDPLSGYFVILSKLVKNNQMETKGYKILLEILTQHRLSRVMEIHFALEKRRAGKSKASIKVGAHYLSDLFGLYVSYFLRKTSQPSHE